MQAPPPPGGPLWWPSASLAVAWGLDALAAGACNLATVGLAARLRLRPSRTSSVPKGTVVARTAPLVAGSALLTALHLWWPTQRLLRSVDGLEPGGLRGRPWGWCPPGWPRWPPWG